MNKTLKYALLGVGGMLLLTLAALAYVVATFDPNAYKAQIIQLVKDKKQRTLKLDGDIKLTFFPSIGAKLGKMSLSEFNSAQPFAALDSAHVSLALLPLLSRQMVVDTVQVSGLRIELVKLKNGGLNLDDLLGKDTATPQARATTAAAPVTFDISAVNIDNAALDYRDEATGARYALDKFSLHSGRIANGVPAKVDLSAHIYSKEPKLDVQAQLKAMLTFDLDKQNYRVEGLDMQGTGAVMDVTGLNVQAHGDAAAALASHEFSAHAFTLAATGSKGMDHFDLSIKAPAFSLTQDKFSANALTLDAKLDGALGKMVANLSIPGLEGNARAFKTQPLTFNLDVQQPEQTFQVKLSTPVFGNLDVPQFNLPELRVAVHATGDKLPGKALSSEMKGSVQVDGARQSIQVTLAGGLLQSQVKARVSVNKFSDPAIRFDVDVDQLDADLYLPKKTAAAQTQASGKQAEQALDLSALKKLNVQGSLRIGSLKAANVKATQVRVDVKAQDGQLNINPLSAKLYQGSINGSLNVNAAGAMPSFSVNQNLSGVDIAPLLKDAMNFDMLEGNGNVTLNLTTQGATVSALKKAVNGNAALSLANGAVKGINLAQKLRGFGKGAQTQAANKGEKTDFSELKATFKVSNGVAHNDDLSLKSPLLRLGGVGDINIGADSINYLAKVTLAKTLEGQGGKEVVGGITVPLRLSGPYTNLQYTLEFGSLVSEVAKQKIEAKKEEVKAKLQDQLKGGLKGLLK